MTRPGGALADIIAHHAPDFMALPGVIGIGEGQSDGLPCLIVFLSCPASEAPDLPDRIDGFPIVVQQIERLQAQPPG